MNYKFNESATEATKRIGAFVSFWKWNETIYALDVDGIVPATQSSRYVDSGKEIIDSAIADLKAKSEGKWIFSSKATRWQQVPISMTERMFIARFDVSAIQNISPETPVNPVFPL